MLKTLFNKLFGNKTPENRNWSTTKQLIASSRGLRFNETGVIVTDQTAMQSSAFFSCVKVISEDIAALPLPVYQRHESGDRSIARQHPAYKLLHDAPNDWMSSNTFRKLITRWVLMYGNGYAYITKKAGVPVRLQPVHPSLVTPRIDRKGNLYYEVKVDGKSEEVSPELMLHIIGLTDDGIVGLSPVESAARQLGIALAADKLAATFYGNGANLGGYLTHPGELPPEAQRALLKSWTENYAGVDNASKTALLIEGATYNSMGIPPEQGQFLESRKFQVEDIARLFRMPPHKIGHLEKATFSNIEHLNIEYVQSTLLNWLIGWEQEINRKLFQEDEKEIYFAEHKVDALLRGDTPTRYAAHSLGIQWGWTTPYRVAQIENMPTAGLSDTPVTPLNMTAATPADAPVDEPAPAEDKSKAPHAVVYESVKRLLTKEFKAIQRASKKHEGQELANWADDFYQSHRVTANLTYAPLVQSYCPKEKAEEILNTVVDQHITSSKRGAMACQQEATLPMLCNSITDEILRSINEY